MLGLLAASALLAQGQTGVGRFDVAERLIALDFAWKSIPDREKHVAAVPHIAQSVNAFLAQNFGPASQGLDEARDVLLGRNPSAADAVTLRFDPPFAEPRSVASLRITWAYLPTDRQPIKISVGSQTVNASPGRDLTIAVHPEAVVPELGQSPESGVLVPVSVGDQSRNVYLSVVKGLRIRTKALLTSKQPEARYLAQRVQAIIDAPVNESERPLIQMLFTAELLNEGRTSLDKLEELPLAHQGETDFRIAFPHDLARKVDVPVTVVIALHGAGGTENMFFEAYGHGEAVKEALDRGWVFASPKVSVTATADVLDWIRTRRHLKVARVFLIGHSMGGLAVLTGAEAITPRPSALALFSPAVKSIPASLGSIPVYLAYAQQDLPMLKPVIDELRKQLATRRGSVVQELEACEHLMSPADGLPGAYKFFDSVQR